MRYRSGKLEFGDFIRFEKNTDQRIEEPVYSTTLQNSRAHSTAHLLIEQINSTNIN